MAEKEGEEMMKTVLGFIEKVLVAFVACAACLGLFFSGCLAVYLVCGKELLTLSTELAILFGSMLLTAAAIRLLGNVRYKRLEILADEMEQQKQTDGQELYEHLKENVYGRGKNGLP